MHLQEGNASTSYPCCSRSVDLVPLFLIFKAYHCLQINPMLNKIFPQYLNIHLLKEVGEVNMRDISGAYISTRGTDTKIMRYEITLEMNTL